MQKKGTRASCAESSTGVESINLGHRGSAGAKPCCHVAKSSRLDAPGGPPHACVLYSNMKSRWRYTHNRRARQNNSRLSLKFFSFSIIQVISLVESTQMVSEKKTLLASILSTTYQSDKWSLRVKFRGIFAERPTRNDSPLLCHHIFAFA